jgi:ATP-dependent RNA circularization protein (DNA/RNA ligase family)
VRHIRSSVPYEYLGNCVFRNILTGAEGVVDEEQASKVFKFNLEMTMICDEFPLVKELVTKLKLKLDVVSIEKQKDGGVVGM